MLQSIGWGVGSAATLVVELFLVWKIVTILARGTINVDLKFWTTWYGGMGVTAEREAEPILYWTGTFGVVVLAVLIAGVYAAVLMNHAILFNQPNMI